jgi:hypothetical protein
LKHPYLLESIARSVSPVSPNELDWHRYIINQGANRIVGYRRGSPQRVREEVDLLVEQLNARRVLKPGRKHITIGPSNKKS